MISSNWYWNESRFASVNFDINLSVFNGLYLLIWMKIFTNIFNKSLLLWCLLTSLASKCFFFASLHLVWHYPPLTSYTLNCAPRTFIRGCEYRLGLLLPLATQAPGRTWSEGQESIQTLTNARAGTRIKTSCSLCVRLCFSVFVCAVVLTLVLASLGKTRLTFFCHFVPLRLWSDVKSCTSFPSYRVHCTLCGVLRGCPPKWLVQ